MCGGVKKSTLISTFFKIIYKKCLPFLFVNDTIFTNENGKGEIVMDDIQKVEKLLNDGDKIILIGYGGGLNTASILLEI